MGRKLSLLGQTDLRGYCAGGRAGTQASDASPLVFEIVFTSNSASVPRGERKCRQPSFSFPDGETKAESSDIPSWSLEELGGAWRPKAQRLNLRPASVSKQATSSLCGPSEPWNAPCECPEQGGPATESHEGAATREGVRGMAGEQSWGRVSSWVPSLQTDDASRCHLTHSLLLALWPQSTQVFLDLTS